MTTNENVPTFEAAMGGVLYTMVKEMKDAGIGTNEAFKLAAALVIEQTLGDEAIRDLVAYATFYRWKAALRDVAAAGITFDAAEQSTVDRVVDHVAEVCDLP